MLSSSASTPRPQWTGPAAGTVAEYSLLTFLNDYDGQGGSIAGATYVGVTATPAAGQTSSEEMLGAHGFLSDDASTLHVLLICRQAEGSMRVDLDLRGTPFDHARLDLYRLDADHTTRAAPSTLSPSERSVTMPPVSAALLVARV